MDWSYFSLHCASCSYLHVSSLGFIGCSRRVLDLCLWIKSYKALTKMGLDQLQESMTAMCAERINRADGAPQFESGSVAIK